MNFLETVLREKSDLVARKKMARPPDEIMALAGRRRGKRPFFTTFAQRFSGETKIVAEFKRSSPSRGTLSLDGGDISGMVRAYERGGAAAVSILTEESYFNGSLTDLARAKEVTNLPILRKDFIVDAYELYETAAFGADAVLLIAEALEREKLEDLAMLAASLDLDVLLEVHSIKSFEKTAHIDGVVTGVNSRDLETLAIDLKKAHEVVAALPPDRPVIIESGINTRSDIDYFSDPGVCGFLIGTSLMRSSNPAKTLHQLTSQKEQK